MAVTLSQIAKVLNFISGIVLVVVGVIYLIELGRFHYFGFTIQSILIPALVIFAGVIIIGFELKSQFFIQNFKFCFGYYGRAIYYAYFAALIFRDATIYIIFFCELLTVAIIVLILAISGKKSEDLEASEALITVN